MQMRRLFLYLYEKSMAINRKVIIAFSAVFSVSILAYLVYSQREILFTYKFDLKYQYLLVAFSIFSIALYVAAFVWGLIMNTLTKPLPIFKHVFFYFFSNIAKRIPGTVWYVAGRGYLYNQSNIPLTLVTVASTIEYAVIILSGILVSVLFSFPQLSNNRSWGVIVVIATVICFLIIQPRSIQWLLAKLHIDKYNTLRYSTIIGWLSLHTFVWILGGIIVFAISNSITPIPYTDLPLVIGSWSLTGVISSVFFFLPSNFGISEVSLSLLLSRIMPTPIAVFVAIFTRLAITLFEAIWALLSIGVIRHNEKQSHQPNSIE